MKMAWGKKLGLRDGSGSLAGELRSSVELVKKAPLGCGPGIASPTVKSKEGPKDVKYSKRDTVDLSQSQVCRVPNPFPKVDRWAFIVPAAGVRKVNSYLGCCLTCSIWAPGESPKGPVWASHPIWACFVAEYPWALSRELYFSDHLAPHILPVRESIRGIK